MLTNNQKEKAMASLHSPADLCERLGLHPTSAQLDLMQAFYEDVDPLQVEDDPTKQYSNTIAMIALWRQLRVKGSRTIVVSASRGLEVRFMQFLREITSRIDPALTSVCTWVNSRTLRFANEAGYELRCTSNRPAFLRGIKEDAVTWVVLGARSSEINFIETLEVVNSYRGREGHRHIILW